MIIFGVDPGTNFTGCGIINFTKNQFTHVFNGLIKLKPSQPIHFRLEIIYDELDRLIKLYRPDEFSIETAFYGKNVQSAMKIGYARGVSILAAVHNKVPVSEYSPREIKKSLVGNGAASKEQVSFMIRTLLELKEEKMRFDESDALAVAMCHAFRFKMPTKKSKDWKTFVEAFPERVIE
ncbi:MAG: crossover junction endodeoxyribonuclease RuvC [Ignavibacteria bacterium CG2_30_36_16]|nr:MAG: crossover junction endodeoxyribonuclease RuvC [Ignavibacteria bacterium CG2_30_36_16]PJA99431.1 MAG: crossover junction endodeoxyribonuclease RuvC [Ignavibacteria bacterium CG_4_9_14_3_um_filter_36_18]